MSALTTGIEIAHEAGALLREHWGRDAHCESKGDWDIVTAADHAVEELLLRRLASHFPSQPVVSEEAGGMAPPAGVSWIVDPLDGTKNFHHRHEFFCTMLARLRDGVPDLAVIYDPIRNETFWAECGGGAFRDGEPIRVSPTAEMRDALIVSGFPSGKRHRGQDPGPFFRVLHSAQALRRTGCTGLDLAYLACGRFDAVWDTGLEPWDVAPGLLVAEEAGAVACGWDGSPYRIGDARLVIATPGLSLALVEILEAHR
jgi:myo-inositol-1(or 4)-monophosphatase